MSQRSGSHASDKRTAPAPALTTLPRLRTYVFPYAASPNNNDDGNETAAAATAIDAATIAGPNSNSSHYSDDVYPFDESTSPVVVATPPLSSTQSKSPTAHAATPVPVHVVPAPLSVIPPSLSVEQLNCKEEAEVSPLSRCGQRVRFAVISADAAPLPDNHNPTETAPYATGSTPFMPRSTATTTITAPHTALDDAFDYTTVESVTSKVDSEELEPYSMITKTGGVHISLFPQLLALLQRTSRQYARQIITLVAEIISPLLFVVLIIILNVAFGKEKIDEVVYAFPDVYSYQINNLDYRTYLCYNDTTQPINGLLPCASLYTAVACDGDESGIPVHGLCYPAYYTIYAVVEQYVASMLGSLIAIPTLDSIISHQWIAKKAGLAASSRSRTALAALSDVGIGVSATTRYDSISYSGKLFFAPAAKVPASLLAYIRSQSAMFDYVYNGTFETVAEAESTIKGSTASQESLDSIWGLIVINDIVDDFDVQIRLHGSALPTMSPPVSVEYRSGFFSDGTDMYLASGFMSLQKVLYDYFYSTKAGNGSLPNVAAGALSPYGTDNVYTLAAAFPSIDSENPYLFSFASSLVAFILALSFLYPFSQMTKRLVLEKELRIRESMCIMGLKRSSLWLNYIIVAFLEYLLICILLTILLCAVVATRSSSFTIFLILLLYSVTLIPLSGLISTFFGRARMAALMSPLIYFVLSMPIFAMGSAGRGAVIGLSILSPTGLAALLTDVFSAEAGGGFHAKDFHNPYFAAKPYIVMIMIACDVVLYLLLMLYLDLVLPQEWGTRRHPLFFITEPYARCTQRRRAARAKTTAKQQSGNGQQSTSPDAGTPEDPRVLERSSEGLLLSNEDPALPTKIPANGSSSTDPVVGRGSLGTASALIDTTSTHTNAFDPTISRDTLTGTEKGVGVRIANLSKYFTRNGQHFAAVNNLSWNMYRGEIAVLLGPNGAGKSTTINMVTGMLAADSGDCFIEGHSVTKETALARHEIGFCPQHNILWPDLTCREHLEFYGKIKGLRGADLEDAVVDILRAVDLEEKIDAIPTLMSGGQKRKLSVAIAFVGRNRVVLLDEPTAGMDPAARRHTWSLLRVMAEQHTILLTTHYMDEADLLGSNVAIVNGGVLQCAGTTKFLRRYAGVGYTVHFDLSPIPAQLGDTKRQAKVEAVWAQLDQVVKRYLVDVRLALQTDAEVEYEMEQEAEIRMPEFLKEMESRGNCQLGIRGYALKAPTLEDVFMRVVENKISTSGGKAAMHAASSPAPPTMAAAAATSEDGRRLIISTDKLPRTSGENNPGGNAAAAAAGGDNSYIDGGSNSASPNLSAASPLHRRMSRASRRFYNDETHLNYGGDAEPSEDNDEDTSTTDAVMPFTNVEKNLSNVSAYNLSGYRFFRHASTACSDIDNKNNNDGSMGGGGGGDMGGEAEEPSEQASSVFVDRVDSTNGTGAGGRPPAWAVDGNTPLGPLRMDPAISGAAPGSLDACVVSQAPTVATKLHPARKDAPLMSAATAAAPLDLGEVRNEAFLYRHVTDRHLDQVWATRAISRRGTMWALQMRGMMYKRFFCAIRDRRMLFFQIICPVLCILLAMLLQLVKKSNNSTVHLSPTAFIEETMMPVSGCTQYYGPVSSSSSVAASAYKVELTDPNYATSADMSYELLDTWHLHKYGRYVGLQCADPRVQLYLTYTYKPSLGNRTVSTLLYNTSSHNSLPIALHTAYAMAYYAGLGNTSATFEMSVTSLPESKKSSKATNAIAGILIGVIVLIPFTFLPANPVAWVVKEYETRARHLQTVSGLHYLIYWAGNFLFDFSAYVVTIILVMIIFVIFQRSEYVGFAAIGPTIVAFALYGVCYCCMSYMVSFFFSEHTTAQLVVLGMSFLTGFLCVMLVFVLSLLDKTLSASNTLRWIFRLLPPYSIGEVILNLALLEQKKQTDESLTAWSMSITVWPDIYMAIEIPVFAAVTLLWDHPNRRAVVERLQASLRACCCCGGGGTNPAKETGHALKDRNKADQEEAEIKGGSDIARSGRGRAGGRRGSAGTPAAITPAAQRRGAQIAQTNADNDSSNLASRNTSDYASAAFLNAAIPNAGQSGEDQLAKSPSMRRRRASAAESSDRADENRPESILVQSSSPIHQSAMERRGSSSLQGHRSDGPSSLRLPNVLIAVPEDHRDNAAGTARSVAAAGGHREAARRRQSTTELSWMQMSAVVAAPAGMVYPPPRWYATDDVCLQEEDSDVEEERNAVYREERVYQAEGHLGKHARTTPATSPAKNTKPKKGKKDQQSNVVRLTPEDHQPQSASSVQQTNADVIRVVDLRKVYDTPHKVAVSDLTFSVMHGEVFGFLGTNGAGKSSALSILTQEQLPTSGRAYVCGHDVVRDSSAAASCLGYCPQFDACLDLLTVKEHLRLYALVRGVHVDQVEALVSSLLTICNLTEHRNVLSSDLSGGNRRKLSVAIALIGAPKVVCLDEPTSGLDPLARRQLWRALDRVSRKCSIILTTHHLEEVEALADCVGIMVDGGLRCFGDLPHLKHKYARNAYELTLCVSATARQRAMEKRQKARQQAMEAAAAAFGGDVSGRRGSTNISSPRPASNNTPRNPASGRSRLGSISYAGTDRIDTSDDIFQFMLRHFPSALLVDNFNNERYVYTLPATRDVANAMQQLQNQQQRRRSVSSRTQAGTLGFSYGSGTHSTFNAPILRLSEVFEKLRAAQEDLGITEYSVSQVSLEQVFLRVCGTAEATKKIRRMSLSVKLNEATPSSPSFGASSPNATRFLQAQHRQQQQQRQKRRSSSVFVSNSYYTSGPVDAASPSRRRLSVAALGGPTTRITFADYRRQRALLRLRTEAEMPSSTPSEAQRATEPDHENSL
jgi:ABC-type multidrug transport system ATPase subunit